MSNLKANNETKSTLPKINKTERNLISIVEINGKPKELENKNNLKKENKTKNNKSQKKLIIALTFICLIIIASLILLIGYFGFGWFQKRQALIVQIKREVNLVSRYLEVKKISNYYDVEGLSEKEKIKNDSIITDFVVGINKKKRTSYFGEIDYLYEAYLLVLNMSKVNDTDFVNLGGINIYDESKNIDELIKINYNLFYENITNNKSTNLNIIPFCKFYFYENGTINDKYFPNNTNEFYKSAISDLIDKIIPKLSSSLYNLEDNKRNLEHKKEGIYLNYKKDTNGENINTTLYEDKFEKNIDNENNKDGFIFEESELNSNLKRIFNMSGDMTSLEMKGEAFFISNKNDKISEIIEANQSYYKLGYNQFKMNVTSNMKLLNNKIEVKILEKLNNLNKKFNFEKPKILNSNLDNEKKSIENNNDNLSNKRKLFNNPNFSNSYNLKYNLMTTSFLGLNIGLNQGLKIKNNTGLRFGYIEAIIGKKKYILSKINYYHLPEEEKNGKILKKLLDKEFDGVSKNFEIFGYLINAELNLKFNVNNGMEYGILNDEIFAKSFSNLDVSVEGTFGPKFIVFSFGVGLTGHIVTGDAYINAKSLLNKDLTRVEYYKKINSCAVDISFYFSVYLLLWEKKYSKTIRLYKGFSSLENYYNDY